MFRSVILLLSGNALGSLMLLARNLLVARLVSVEDYGIAATFAISMAIVEMASGLGLQQLIVQDKEGNDPRLQAGLHGFNLLRGLLSGAILFLLASPIAQFLGIPDVAWAYQMLALVPALRGFEHFDIHRLNRRMVYRPLILSKTVPAFLSVLSLWPLYQFFADYRVMLYAVLIQWACTVAASHLLAERPFRIRFDLNQSAHALSFGWPILVNNILLFAVFQGDKLIVGRELGIEALAIFAMGVTLTLTPTLVTAASETQFFLPQLSAAAQHRDRDRDRFAQLAAAAMQASLLSSLFLVLAVFAFGPPTIRLLLGAKYEALVPLLSWLAIQQAVRNLKVGCAIVALSRAHTSNAMIANTMRILVLPLAWYAATIWGDVLVVIWVAIAGEAIAFAVSLVLVHYRLSLDFGRVGVSLIAGVLAIATLATSAISTSTNTNGNWYLVVISLACLAIVAMNVRDLITVFRDAKTDWREN
ncbi:oligosaccharide flippase family protein [Marimonas arenosa]|nr:oligosaccharide flippase family protein [Marimonas arenosa]